VVKIKAPWIEEPAMVITHYYLWIHKMTMFDLGPAILGYMAIAKGWEADLSIHTGKVTEQEESGPHAL
jgi:hypothetical protein